MLTEMKLLTPERGPGPRTVIAVGPPRTDSECRIIDGALGRGSQALSAESTLRSKAVILATNNEEQATDVTCRNLPEHAILLSTTSSRVQTTPPAESSGGKAIER